jgi:Cu-Zn family superoxide dismutase
MNRSLQGIALAMLAAGCTSMAPSTSGPLARATLAPTAVNDVNGIVTFEPRGDKVRVVARVSGLAPGGHGFHIHEKGDCSAPDGMSAGGHFNPGGKPHGDPARPDHHGGDMPMLVADAGGNATLDATIDTVTLGGGAADIVGKAVIVHKDADDYRTQPTGNSGARLACGVIARA